MRSYAVGSRWMPSRRALPRAIAAGLAIAALAATGCSLETKDEVRVQPVYTALNAETPPEPGTPPEAFLTIGPGYVTATGKIVAACAITTGEEFATRLDQSSGTLTLHVIYRAPANCPPLPTVVQYSVLIFNLPAGAYTVNLIHEGDSQVASGTTVLTQSVNVF